MPYNIAYIHHIVRWWVGGFPLASCPFIPFYIYILCIDGRSSVIQSGKRAILYVGGGGILYMYVLQIACLNVGDGQRGAILLVLSYSPFKWPHLGKRINTKKGKMNSVSGVYLVSYKSFSTGGFFPFRFYRHKREEKKWTKADKTYLTVKTIR